MLELKGLSKHFGGVRAVDGLDLNVPKGEVFGLIGPNGSGKSTVVNLVCGLFPVTAGQVLLRDEDITGLASHVRVARGVTRTFQNIRLFGQLSVWQNLWVAQNSTEHRSESFLRRWLGGPGRAREEIDRILEFSDLSGKRDELAGNLAFGEQRRLELARAVVAKPALLLLDEPAAGMNAEEIDQLDARIRKLKQDGLTMLLDRASHGAGDGGDGSNCGSQFRPEDRRGNAGRSADQSAGAASLSRRGGGGVMEAMLEIADVVTAYGKIEALKGVSLSAARGRITCLLGPNGAGKTTLMMSIAGALKPRQGSIKLEGTELVGLSPARIVGNGVALVPENRLVFPQMSVRENLLAGAYQRNDSGEVAADIERMYARFPQLKERREQLAGTLSGGEQQMLAVARALMSRPRLLLMDEPSLGLAPIVVKEIFAIIAELNREGVTIFLVEQNAHLALQVAHHFYLMEQGRVTFSGNPGELAEDEVIKRAYLGTRRSAG